MAAPIYTQQQIDRMLKIPKSVPYDAWENRFEGRQSTDELRDRFKARPIDETDLTEFTIEICRCSVRHEASFTLFGRLLEYPEHPICRYEIQLCRHRNLKWFPPRIVDPRMLHKHVYSERAIREGWPWDKCAEPIGQNRKNLSLEQAIGRLTPVFLENLKIEIHDSEVQDLFHQG